MRMHLIYAVVAAVAAIAIPVYYWVVVPEPKQLQENKAFFEAVAKLSDPDHLKKVVAQISKDADAFLITAKRTVDATIVLLAIVLAASAAAFLHSYIELRRVRNGAQPRRTDAL
jgi:hypothetical protein